jgi:hypothetical protein
MLKFWETAGVRVACVLAFAAVDVCAPFALPAAAAEPAAAPAAGPLLAPADALKTSQHTLAHTQHQVVAVRVLLVRHRE